MEWTWDEARTGRSEGIWWCHGLLSRVIPLIGSECGMPWDHRLTCSSSVIQWQPGQSGLNHSHRRRSDQWIISTPGLCNMTNTMRRRWHLLVGDDNVLNGAVWDDMGFLLALIWELCFSAQTECLIILLPTQLNQQSSKMCFSHYWIYVKRRPGIFVLLTLTPSDVTDISWGLRRQMTTSTLTISYLCCVGFLGGFHRVWVDYWLVGWSGSGPPTFASGWCLFMHQQ